MLWEILKASKGILVADFYADLWANIAGGGTPVDVFVEMIGTLPLYYDGKGIDLADYLISGNTVQDGTPSPEAPVDVAGCGVWDETRQSYKLPLTVNGTEYPIYLGQVETTRRVKKLVLDGTEDVSYNARSDTSGRWVVTIPTENGTTTPENVICTHFKTVNTTAKPLSEGGICMRSTGVDVVVGGLYTDIGITSPSDSRTITDAVKSYLASQYAAGTPVTVWYVLAEPKTAVVNEPLYKIGDYTDTVSFAQAGVTIPTVNGENVLDMTSPVKPSEVYVKGKGIKPTGDRR